MNIQKGFTLIELLVVIAVIGIFSAVAVVATTTPRNKSADAAVKANLKTIMSEAQLYLGNTGSYGSNLTSGVDCPTSSTNNMFGLSPAIKSAILAANSASGGTAKCSISLSGSRFVVWSPLKTGGYWCVDHTGVPRPQTDAMGGQVVCP